MYQWFGDVMRVRIYQYINLPRQRGDDVHSGIVLFGGAMGLFGGKDKKDSKNEGTSSSPRKSRRIVAPGGKPAAPPAPAAPAAPPANKNSSSGSLKPTAPRPPAPPAPATQRPPTSRVMRQQPPPAAPAAQMPDMITAPPRPKGKDPITAGSSRPPEFTGGLATAGRRDGPCRTGDAALLDFLQNKANLLDAGQVGQVRGVAETQSLQIDVAAVELGFITEEQMVNALTQECWVPHLKVDKYEIRKKALDTISREDATHYGVFPVDKLGSLLTLAMVNPLDVETIRVLENKTSLDIKKVVATRTEIMQGIEKYYSGQVQAKDTSISFTQDIEPKSVTQMLSKVAPSAPPPPAPPSRPMPTVTPAPAPVSIPIQNDNIVPEIQDIDDLLSSDEAIAPAIIEPISLTPDAFEAVTVEPIEMEPMEVEQEVSAAPKWGTSNEFAVGDAPAADEDTLTRKPPAPAAPIAAEFEMDDGPSDAIIPPMPPAPAAKSPSIAPEFEFDDGPAIAPPAAKAPAPKAPPAAVPPPAAPPRPSPPPARAPAPAAKAPDAPKPATSRFTGTARAERSGIINLIPVTEDEFQHAITHGKSHVFEKWVGLQSRNRIINAVSVESEFDELLAGLYEGAVAV